MNKVMLIGNVGADPEVRYVEEEWLLPVCVLPPRSAAIPYRMVHRCLTVPTGIRLSYGVKFPAEIVEKYVHKGDKALH